MNPNKPAASQASMRPLPREYVSSISGKTIRPLDKAETHEPVRDMRPKVDPEELGREILEYAACARQINPDLPLSEIIGDGREFIEEIANLDVIELDLGGNGAREVHTDDSREFLRRARERHFDTYVDEGPPKNGLNG
jgi:hypothetical protein